MHYGTEKNYTKTIRSMLDNLNTFISNLILTIMKCNELINRKMDVIAVISKIELMFDKFIADICDLMSMVLSVL